MAVYLRLKGIVPPSTEAMNAVRQRCHARHDSPWHRQLIARSGRYAKRGLDARRDLDWRLWRGWQPRIGLHR